MTITRLEDLNHRLNIMITNASMGLMERLPGTITKDTIINGSSGKHPLILRILWPLPIIGSMRDPEPMHQAPDHKTL
jgi:hypothetical protein